MTIFDYADGDSIGDVQSVDTAAVVIDVPEQENIQRLQVNHLIVLRSAKAGQHLIGFVQRIMRRQTQQPYEEGEEDTGPRFVMENVVRASLMGTLIDRRGTTDNVFRRALESVPEIGAACFLLEGERLTKFMRAISASAAKAEDALVLGNYILDEQAKAYLDGNRFFQRHAVIVGSTGSGKSWTVARLLEQAAKLPTANAILFDIHGEYRPLSEIGLKLLKVAGPGDLDATTAALDSGTLFIPYWLLSYEDMLALVLDRSDNNAPNQAMLLAKCVVDAKRKTLEDGKHKDILANFTIDSPIPYSLSDVIAELSRLDSERVPGVKAGSTKAGPFNGKLTRFVQRLEAKLTDRRLGFMFQPPAEALKYEWLPDLCKRLMDCRGQGDWGGVKVIDFSEVPSDVLPLVVSLVARLVFSVQQWVPKEDRNPIALLAEEAHLYIPSMVDADSVTALGLKSFERIAKEGRKYGVALCVISQRPAEVNRTVLSQSGNFVVMRLTNGEDQAVVRRLLPDSLGGLAEAVPILDIGESIVVGDASLLPVRVRVDAPTVRPSSGTVAFWDMWAREKAPEPIDDAVEAFRRQSQKEQPKT